MNDINNFFVKKYGRYFHVIIAGNKTIAIHEDGFKGKTKCNPIDKYDRKFGIDMAIHRAVLKELESDRKCFIRAIKNIDADEIKLFEIHVKSQHIKP